MYRIRLYIVPEQDELVQASEEANDWWSESKVDGLVTVTHRARKSNIITLTGEPPNKKDYLRNARNNSKKQRYEVNVLRYDSIMIDRND